MAPNSVAGSSTPATSGAAASDSATVKVAFPDTFNGDRKKLKSFLIQTELWLLINQRHFANDTEKVVWAVTLLRGLASDWVANYLADYFTHRTSTGQVTTEASATTKEIFLTWKGFVKNLKLNFGDPDEKRTATQNLQKLRQIGSAIAYTALFQQYASQMS